MFIMIDPIFTKKLINLMVKNIQGHSHFCKGGPLLYRTVQLHVYLKSHLQT